MNQYQIASMMLCDFPKYLNDRYIISAYDGVWEPISNLPKDLEIYFTDELGNLRFDNCGALQLINELGLKELNSRNIFSCFRAVDLAFIDHVQVWYPKKIYEKLENDIVHVGWDICTGNGWRTASCDGYFPIDPFSGKDLDENSKVINKFGLFGDFDNVKKYCEINNSKIPKYYPWYPVSVYIDKYSFNMLNVE